MIPPADPKGHTVSHSENTADQAHRLIEAVEDVYRPAQGAPTVPALTSFRDPSPLPVVGDTPPVQQPGARQPMSQRATDLSGLMLAGGIASLPFGAAASLVLYALGQVDPVSLAIAAGAPIGLVTALGAVVRRLKDTHTEHHHHYSGTVHQDHHSYSTTTRGLIARTRNELGR